MGNSSAASPMAGLTTKAAAIKKYAVVTGGNKGIGLEICRQLASQGVSVVLTARNEKRGLEAVDKLNKSGFSDNVMFHQVDVTDLASLRSLAECIKSQIGRLDILVNNAGINGVAEGETGGAKTKRTAYDLAAECLQINYYGTKKTVETLLPLLELSDSPRIVNVSSTMGMLGFVRGSKSAVIWVYFLHLKSLNPNAPWLLVCEREQERYVAWVVTRNDQHYQCWRSIRNKWARDTLSYIESLTEEKLDQVVNEFLKDFKEGSAESKGWPGYWSAYCVSKAVVTAYTRLLAKKYPRVMINCVCPGWIQTDLTSYSGPLKPEQGAKNVVRLALLPENGPSGFFYDQSRVSEY